jgi:two-component system NtrC family sensor kinase
MNSEIRILCVDDEQSVLDSIKRLFHDDNYRILTAGSGEEGLKILEQTPVQIIISDGRMYGMTGSDFLREVCKRWPDTVRIILSGHSDPASIVSAINDGQVYRYIPKPWNNDELRAAVANAAERCALVRENAELNAELKMRHKELEGLLQEKEDYIKMKACMLSAFQNILDAVPTGILGIDPDNLIVHCNARCCQILGHHVPLISEKAEDVLPPGLIKCMDDVRQKSRVAMQLKIHGVSYCAMGVKLQSERHKGIVISLHRIEEI